MHIIYNIILYKKKKKLFRFQDDEITALVQLLTSRPPPTPAGVRFVSLALCMLIACPSLIATPEHEKKSIAWVHWLVKGEKYFERYEGKKMEIKKTR